MKEDREGFYLCQADNGIGTGLGKVVQVKVNCKLIVAVSCNCAENDYEWKIPKKYSPVSENMALKRTAVLTCNLFDVFMFQA